MHDCPDGLSLSREAVTEQIDASRKEFVNHKLIGVIDIDAHF